MTITSQDKKLLLVEDDLILMRRFKRELSKIFKLSAARSLAEANAFLKNQTFDIILTDLHLNNEFDQSIDGLTLITNARLKDRQLTIAAMSSDHALKPQAIQAGANFFVEKPFEVQTIIACFEGRSPNESK
jgi:ActR/RegA family two-component response regulator